MSRTAIVTTSLALLLGGQACQTSASNSTFRVRVFGESRQALEQTAIASQGLELAGGPFLDGTRFYALFQGRKPLDELQLGKLALSAANTVELTPYLCRLLESYDRRRSDGWSSVETHDVQITNSGELKLNRDFTRELSYSCELSAPESQDDGEGGTGIATYFARPNRCDAVEAVGTTVAITGTDGHELTAANCLAVHTNWRNGTLSLQLDFRGTAGDLTVRVGHCLPAEGAVPPIALRSGDTWPDPECKSGSLAQWTPRGSAAEPRNGVLRGIWTVLAADLSDGGRQVSDLELTLRFDGEPALEYALTAHVDSPVIRLPDPER